MPCHSDAMPRCVTQLRPMVAALFVALVPMEGAPAQGVEPQDTSVPSKDYAKAYRQSFKGNTRLPPEWTFTSRAGEQYMHFEPAGLRIALPPGELTSSGIVSRFGLQGDFEITLSFDALKDPDPADAVGKTGTRLTLTITLDTPQIDTPQSEVAALSRSMASKGLVTWARVRDRAAPLSHSFPTPTTIGRLALVRSSADLFYLGASGATEPLRVLKKYRFGADDVKRIAITANTGTEKALLDVRVSDLAIRADAITGSTGSDVTPTPPPAGRRRLWLVAAVSLGLAIVLAGLCVLAIHKRGRVALARNADEE
jgi:hypothetical protein